MATPQLSVTLCNMTNVAILGAQGMVTLALSTWIPGLQPPHEGDSANWIQNLALYGSLYIVALGTGGIKPNVSAFGADQFDMSSPKVRGRPVLDEVSQIRISANDVIHIGMCLL